MIINCTPHAIRVRFLSDDPVHDLVYPPSGLQARVTMTTELVDAADDGCPISEAAYGAATLPEGLPSGAAVIVSTMFADAFRRQHPENRTVLLVPDSGPDAYRVDGRVIAVRSLIRR